MGVFFIAICLQWLVYDDWLHKSGPLRLVGSAVAFFLTFVFAFRWQMAARRRKIETLHRFETIRWMNDRIRNSLQAIECLVYASNPHAMDPVKEAVDTIEIVLDEVLSNSHPEASGRDQRTSGNALTQPALMLGGREATVTSLRYSL